MRRKYQIANVQKENHTASSQSEDAIEATEISAPNELKNKIMATLKKIWPGILALIIAYLVYTIGVKATPGNMSYFLKNLIGLILSLMFLWGFQSVTSGKPGQGKSVVIFMLMIFVYNLANAPDDGGKMSSNNQVGNNLNAINALIIDQSGTYVYKLKAGQSTGWIGFSEGRIADVSYSSPDYHYVLNYSDNTSYPGGKDTIIPEKNHCYVNIVAKTDEFVTMMVKYHK